MSLLLVGDPAQALQIMRHLRESQRLDEKYRNLFLEGRSHMLRWASRMFNPQLLKGIPERCRGAVILMDLAGIYYQNEQFHIDFSMVTKCVIIEQTIQQGGPVLDPLSPPLISANCSIPDPGCYPIEVAVTLGNETLFQIERFGLSQNPQHFTHS